MAELTDLLGRHKFKAKIAASGFSVDQLVDRYAMLTVVVRIARDPDDDHVIACAIAAQADFIVSGDHDLLDLGQYQGIAILNASDALVRIA